MNIHDIIANEFVETKSIASFIYLIELGREVELLYKDHSLFVSRDGAKNAFSIWVDKDEQSFNSVEELLLDGLILGKKILEIWEEIEINSLL